MSAGVGKMASFSFVPEAKFDTSTDTEIASETVETEGMLAVALEQRTSRTRLVLVGSFAIAALLGAAAAAAAFRSGTAQPAHWRNKALPVSADDATTQTWTEMGCSDWKSATIARLKNQTIQSCNSECQRTPGCEYTNYQSDNSCNSTEKAAAGTCYLFSKCEMEANACWVLTKISGPNGMGCENWKTAQIKMSKESSQADCETECMTTAGCNHANYQFGDCAAGDGVNLGTCYLFSSCKVERSPCWTLTNVSGPEKYTNQGGTGCVNWDSLTIGTFETGHTVDTCAELCAEASDCAQFNIQTLSCGKEGISEGACYLFREGCVEETNACWDLYTPSSVFTTTEE